MSGHRQAAVALHGLAEADLDLILGALPPTDQAILRGHLRELTDLGFDEAEPEARWLKPADSMPQPGAEQRVAAASAGAMLALLEQESAPLIAQVLALRDWPWAGALLERWPRRAHLGALQLSAAGSICIGVAKRDFLLQELATRLAASHLTESARPGDSILSAMLRRAKSWTR